jgi:intracellular septation protein A
MWFRRSCFLIVYRISGSVYTAAGVATAAALAGPGWLCATARVIELIQWSGLALIAVLGGGVI